MNAPPGPDVAVAASARQAGPGDVELLAQLYRDAAAELSPLRGGRTLVGRQRRSEPLEGFFRALLGEKDWVVAMATLSGTVVGYGTGHFEVLNNGEKLGKIEDLYVAPEHRRQGAGTAVTATLVDWCREKGCVGVDAQALPGSRAVKSFFEGGHFTARVLVMHRKL